MMSVIEIWLCRKTSEFNILGMKQYVCVCVSVCLSVTSSSSVLQLVLRSMFCVAKHVSLSSMFHCEACFIARHQSACWDFCLSWYIGLYEVDADAAINSFSDSICRKKVNIVIKAVETQHIKCLDSFCNSRQFAFWILLGTTWNAVTLAEK